MSAGQLAYERDLLERPHYHDGTPRRSWAQLESWAQKSWEKNPHPLPCAPINAGGN